MSRESFKPYKGVSSNKVEHYANEWEKRFKPYKGVSSNSLNYCIIFFGYIVSNPIREYLQIRLLKELFNLCVCLFQTL